MKGEGTLSRIAGFKLCKADDTNLDSPKDDDETNLKFPQS